MFSQSAASRALTYATSECRSITPAPSPGMRACAPPPLTPLAPGAAAPARPSTTALRNSGTSGPYTGSSLPSRVISTAPSTTAPVPAMRSS